MSWVRMAVWMGLALALVAGGCKGDDADDDDDDVTGDDDVVEGSPADYVGGDFSITTLAVNDGCLDGALEVLFMPNGPATPNAWEFPTYLPPFADMPSTYPIDLRDPFLGIVITVEDAGDYQMRVEDAVMEEVLLGEDRYGDCAVTMTCDVAMTVLGRNRVEGTTAISLSEPRGDDGRCPVFDQLPCTMNLTLDGELVD